MTSWPKKARQNETEKESRNGVINSYSAKHDNHAFIVVNSEQTIFEASLLR